VDNVDQIRNLHRRWIDAERDSRIDDLRAMVADSITLLPPGSAPIAGRQAVMEWMRQHSEPILSIHVDDPVIAVGEGLASLIASFRTVLGSAATSVKGQHAWLLRRTSAGWYIEAIAWSVNDNAA